MGRYLGSWKIDDIIRVHKQTSSVTTGSAVDADSVPTWRVYEDDTATPVTTGSFSTLNSQAGFYVAAITLAAAIGYEKGKTYAVRSQATVSAIIGADVDTFQIEAEVDSNSVSVTVNANAVALAAGAITALTITDGALTSTKFGAGFITAGSITDGAFTSPKFGAGFITAGSITDGAFISSKFGAGFITAGSFSAGALAGQPVTVNATAASAIAALVTGASIGPVTVNATAAAAIAAQVTANSIGAVTVGATAAAAIQSGLATQASVDIIDDFLDTEIAAIKAKTDQLTFTTSNSIKSDIRFVNGVSVTGNGQVGNEWGPGS